MTNQCLFAFPHVNFFSLEFSIKELHGSYFSLLCTLAWLELGDVDTRIAISVTQPGRKGEGEETICHQWPSIPSQNPK